jgi:hypothetical protein
MSRNIYETPSSQLVEDCEVGLAPFYVVSPRKFLLLFVSTFGMYHIYWFYKNWAIYKSANGAKIWPVMRGLFSIFFAHSLFNLIDLKLKSAGKQFVGSYNFIATIYVLFSVTEKICDRLSLKSIGDPYTDIGSFIALPFIGWSLYKAQLSANIASDDVEGKENSQITPLNFLWIFLGLFLWALMAFGLYTLIIDK